LVSAKCSVSRIPKDRWSHERLLHPRGGERGRAYTFAAGALDDIWGFDPAAFGLSPREAEQMDPQQRLLLELTWEALEDAGIKPAEIAGSETGVFVGASALDYGNLRILDAAAGDAYFATGNTLSIISNRISYIYDLHGPSFTVDTACSSALVALNEAVTALRSGRIDTAIVAGVNVLSSPHSFVGFSQATMLSRTGLCQAFSAKADGYVRAEGGVVLVLRNRPSLSPGDRIHAMIAASHINSDGRTTGISLPSKTYQSALLRALYAESDIDPSELAFVEAHGTGTRVGDPIEAMALGEIIGQRRSTPLPIGSIKTNIGHLEAGSGLAGVLKAILALEHDFLPASLHFDEPNPDIDFSGLNLQVCAEGLALPRGDTPRLAGINSFGFGGTNAHIVLGDAPTAAAPSRDTAPKYLLISAHSRAALNQLAADYATRLAEAEPDEAAEIVAAAGHRRARLSQRLVMPYTSKADLIARLGKVEDEAADATDFAVGTAPEAEARVAFVYSGNGSQWAGMGVVAYATNPAFKARFDAITKLFEKLSGWSLAAAMQSTDLEEKLTYTKIAQPLLFAVQSAATHALKSYGLVPSFVLGHSVGEVAAAEAAGILDLENAVRIIHFRSLHQETARGRGAMAVVVGAREATDALIAEIPELSIAATNSPRAFTISGSIEDIEHACTLARSFKARVRRLDLAYPFHSHLLAPVEAPLLRDLAHIDLAPGTIAFMSTVSGQQMPGHELDGHYWWRNVREPVRFMEAVQESARLGGRLFIEIGPAATVLSHINDSAEAAGFDIASFCVLDRKNKVDPFPQAFATALSRGAAIDAAASFGKDPGARVELPTYPWQRKAYRLPESAESPGIIRPSAWHPLIGARFSPEKPEWHSTLDTMLLPYLGDHKIEGQAVLPGAAFLEMALAVARDWLGVESVTISDLEIVSPMHLAADSSREVMCHVSPSINLIEIVSRPRLTQGAWQTHATAKIVKEAGQVAAMPAWSPPEGSAVGPEVIYQAASFSGLLFGPAFRQVGSACRVAHDQIRVDLLEAAGDPDYGLHPARLDSCFHGLILLFSEAMQEAAGVAYIPVRFGEVRLLLPGVGIAHAQIDVQRCDERSIIANFALFDAEGALIATLREARYQAIRTSRASADSTQPLCQASVLAWEPTAARNDKPLPVAAIHEAARDLGRLQDRDALTPDFVLLEGWATAVAFHAAKDLAAGQEMGLDIDPEALVDAGRLPANARAWFEDMLVALERSGLASRQEKVWHLDTTVALPDPETVLRAFAADHQRSFAELLLAASVSRSLEALVAGDLAAFNRPIAASTLDAFEVGGIQAVSAAACLSELLERSVKAWPKDRAMRILQIGYGPLSSRAVALAAATHARLTIFDPERRRLERARLSFDAHENMQFIDKLADLPQRGFDIVIASEALQGMSADPVARARLQQAMARGAVFAAIEPRPSLFRDMVFGLQAARAGDAALPITGIVSEAGWIEMLQALGLSETRVDSVATEAGTAYLLSGQAASERRHWVGEGNVLIVADGNARGTETTSAFATLLASSGLHVAIALDSDLDEPRDDKPDTVIFFAGASEDHSAALRSLAEKCLRLKLCVERLGGRKTTLWVVTSGATTADGRTQGNVATGFWAFSRTLANEYQNIDMRRVDLAADLNSDTIAERLRDLVLSKTDETEIVLGEVATRVVRFEAPAARNRAGGAPAEAARLERGEGSGIDRIHWAPITRRSPGAGEVEIAVEATGLNFRDVMWGLGILPEDILENGFAGPTLGLECAGRIARVGSGNHGFKPGDCVIAFAKSAFSTHVTVPVAVVAAMPRGLSPEAAATIPVTFLTAYYGLITCGNLKKREWVLIHGGAGGVGLAAVQIAQWRGARIIATASSPEKRALLKALGVDHVFDSRTGSFVDEVKAVTREGVSVVLNSLSGEAMERSIGVLRPFGRFVELGKRDYVANTHIGLRPFRRNLTYYGVDLDQLLLNDAAASKKLFQSVLRLFENGTLTPLPYRTFEAHEIVDAFRLMQQSGHVGKLVVKPPAAHDIRLPSTGGFEVASDKTHLITGGLGGFGLETALWLADKGARHILLVGRSGAATPEAQAAVAALAARGVKVRAEALDIADKATTQRLSSILGRDMPPLAGVIHAAMVLEDALIANLDAEKFERVLRPKIAGAELLDAFTRSMPLDYFVLFSSATTMIGNPGQGSYVAANGYLEGLARRRRRAGLPALAIAWGAIEDVGVLARAKGTRETLASRAGVKGLKARDALGLMAKALATATMSEDEAMIVLAPINFATAREHLPALRSPTYAALARNAQSAEGGERAKVDVSDMLAHDTPENVRKTVSGLIVEEISRVLRLPREDVSRTKALSEIGLDSLMAVELALGLEERFGLKGSLSASASGFTVVELADHVVNLATGSMTGEDSIAKGMVERHLGNDVDAQALEAASALVWQKSRSVKDILH